MPRQMKKEFLDLLTETDVSPWELSKISNETELLFMIPNVEAMIRKSHEYRVWIAMLRNRYGMTVTMDQFAVDTVEKSLTTEFHHTPITLFDVCYTVGMKQLDEIRDKEGVFITSFDVAKEVIDLHMRNLVGATLLTKTVHEIVHLGMDRIPEEKITGKYAEFIRGYRKFIPEDVRMRIESNLGKEIDKL